MSWLIRHQSYEDFETGEFKEGYRFYDSVTDTYFGPAMKTRMELAAFHLFVILDNLEITINDPRAIDTDHMRKAFVPFLELKRHWEAE